MNAETIRAAAHDVTDERGARLLHAIESGSRAWGFASPDSDYDVRFLYVHSIEWYLRITPDRDSIERMLPGDLDLSGWELRKALGLFARSNVALFEHLGSDIVYFDDGIGAELQALIPTFFNPIAAGHHYLGAARTTLTKHFGATPTIKKLFYVLRPLAALHWIAEHRSMPPTRFDRVLDGIGLPTSDRERIDAWRTAKATAAEGDRAPLDPAARAWIERWFVASEPIADTLPPRPSRDHEPLNAILRRQALNS